MYQSIIYQLAEGVAVVTLNRPQKLNTLTFEMMDELNDVLDKVETDGGIGAFMVWGSETVFGAGADLGTVAGLQQTPISGYRFSSAIHTLVNRIEAVSKPTLAAIAGYCLGGSLELALGFDVRIASEGAKFGLPELSRGSIPGGGGTIRLSDALGASRAKYMMFTGERLSAREALDAGMVSKVVADGTLYEEAFALAKEFARLSPNAVLMTKTSVAGAMNPARRLALEHERKSYSMLYGDKEKLEKTQAFLDRKKQGQ